MVGDSLKISVDLLPSPTLDGDGYSSFGVPHGGGDSPHIPQGAYFKISIVS